MKNRHTAILDEWGLKVKPSECSIPVVSHIDLKALCQKQGLKFEDKFNELATGQTCVAEGMYYYDVANILKTITTGIDLKDWD